MNSVSETELFTLLKKDFITPNGSLYYCGELLYLAYKRYAGKIALVDAKRSLSFKEFYLRSVSLSKMLLQQNIKPQDKVVLFSNNSIEFYLAYFAIWQIGAVITPLNTFLHEKELAFIIRDAAPKACIVSSELQETILKLQKAHQDALPSFLLINDGCIDFTTPINTLEKEHHSFQPITLKEDDVSLLLYTSGTTGQPKGVMLSSRNIMTNVLQGYARFESQKLCAERFFCVLPLFHIFAQNVCMWLPIMTGGSVIIVARIDRTLILQALQHKPTLFFGVPALYGLLCLMKNAPLESVKLFVSGADAMPDKIRAAFAMIYGRKICSGYGLTEATPMVAVNANNAEHATNVVGEPLPHISCQIRNEEGLPLPVGTIGTLWLKGDNIMMGYYNSPESTNDILKDGWLNTGDLARFDNQGKLAICGRSKDLIIHKGFNIYPQEIENVLLQHPAVVKAAIIGQEEEESGQIPVAYVAVKGNVSTLASTLRTYCQQNLASYKVPRKFVCLDDLPMNATGKVDKKRLLNTK